MLSELVASLVMELTGHSRSCWLYNSIPSKVQQRLQPALQRKLTLIISDKISIGFEPLHLFQFQLSTVGDVLLPRRVLSAARKDLLHVDHDKCTDAVHDFL